jgi:membrane-associated protein
MRLYSMLASLGLDPEKLLASFGTIGLFAIIFAESGIMVGFFLPGDSLLFAAGLLSAKGTLPNIAIISIGCAIAAIAGDQVGYSFGLKVGPSLFKRPDSRFFKQEYLAKAEEFFEHYGAKAIILARFVPIVRTFTPIVAGASSMHYRTFLRYNIIGGVAWAVAFTQLGYWLGRRYPWMLEKIDVLVIVIVAFSLVPMAVEVFRHRRRSSKASASAAADDSAA